MSQEATLYLMEPIFNLGVNTFSLPAFCADYERRGSGCHDHEESRAILAQKIEKETVGNKKGAWLVGRREEGSKGLFYEQIFNA